MTHNSCHKNTLTIVFIALTLIIASVGYIPSTNSKTGEVGPTLTPAGSLVTDATTKLPAVGALPVAFVRSPDHSAGDGLGRYLIVVNSGFGVQFSSAGNRAQQSIAVIDLNAKPEPMVVQNVYFPTPQSVNVGLVFSPTPDKSGAYSLYASGGFENKIWIFRFLPGSENPITPVSPGPNSKVEAPFIDVSSLSSTPASPRYNKKLASVYPAGMAISGDGNILFVANNLADSLGIIRNLTGAREITHVDLFGTNRNSAGGTHFVYPYAVVAIPPGPPGARDFDRFVNVSPTRGGRRVSLESKTMPDTKVYVSCWNDSTIAVVRMGDSKPTVSYIPVGRHPTSMIWDGTRSRLYVVNSDDDSVSMIDTRYDREVERINLKLSESALAGNSPEGLALDSTGLTLYVANAHSNTLAVVSLSPISLSNSGTFEKPEYVTKAKLAVSKVRGFIPTGQYPSAVALAGETIFVGNGKGTGVENSSLVVSDSGRAPNAPNERFPAGTGRGSGQGGQYSVSLVTGNISAIRVPDDPTLLHYSQQSMRNNGLLGALRTKLFAGASPIKHVIYVIKENRTYDQIFGDIEKSGDGSTADGDKRLAIFGSGEAAQRPGDNPQDISPNHRALALRFGLFDRFFVNSEASPDGHNWSTAAFSSDYVDKAYRWQYGDRGRGYDYEGFNRLPDYEPVRGVPSLFSPTADADDVANFMRRFVPYLHGSRDVAEPQTLYLWDAASRAGLTYRNYGEFVATLSEADVTAIRTNRSKSYPDTSPTVKAFATKKALEGHYSSTFRNFDLDTPDSMTVDSYRAAKNSARDTSPLIDQNNADHRFRGTSRIGTWLEEFRAIVRDRQAGKPDRLPNLSIVRLSNDHTDGIKAQRPTPQFFVADNDFALGLMVEAVSTSPYWRDTAIIVLEDDAQDGPDHIDAHRSVALVISAYNQPGRLVHEFHNTVSLVRTIELLLGIRPMNQLDASAVPVDIFRAVPDLQPYRAKLPNVSLDNLINERTRNAATAYWMERTSEQDLSHPDMADPSVLNQIIWFSVRGDGPMPTVSRLPAFDAMKLGIKSEREEIAKSGTVEPEDDQ